MKTKSGLDHSADIIKKLKSTIRSKNKEIKSLKEIIDLEFISGGDDSFLMSVYNAGADAYHDRNALNKYQSTPILGELWQDGYDDAKDEAMGFVSYNKAIKKVKRK